MRTKEVQGKLWGSAGEDWSIIRIAQSYNLADEIHFMKNQFTLFHL